MRRFAGKVVEGVRQVDQIVRSLLGFSRPDRGSCRIASIVEIVSEAAAGAGIAGASIRVDGDRALRVDADVLLRVLTNLFRNAVEASPGVGIHVTAAARSGRLELLVADDGPGVPQGVGRRAFEPFVSTKERGTGLGLPLSARVLAYLGGDLELLNPGEPGARFRVRMPLAEVPSPAVGAAAVTEEVPA
jgi:signal transduction histidine kinase